MCNEQDIRNMGGLWKKIPFTYCMMWIGSLALMGVYPFAGFYSKDLILEVAYISGTKFGIFAYYIGLTTAFFTAVYSLRLMILVFHGKPKLSEQALSNVHESPLSMAIPLLLLSFGAIFAGYIGEHYLHIFSIDNHFWHNSLLILDKHRNIFNITDIPSIVKLLPLIACIIALIISIIMYVIFPSLPEKLTTMLKPVYKLLYNKYYFDELYNMIFVRLIKLVGLKLWQNIDIKVIDDLGPNLSGRSSIILAGLANKFQSGYVYQYALVMLTGLVVIISWYIVKIFI
jgi:NADH-quinone oxidoreductase subunit L